ncbi:MAG: carbamoyltransferase [Magnetovibrio sp.]|nr:carbamoyltransferase [Magnetovibrio sp.]
MTIILGISAFYHDSAAALVIDGEIVAAAQEERFTRKKHDSAFPSMAIQSCLEEADIKLSDVEHIVFYDDPVLKFDRLLKTYLAYAPKGFGSFIVAVPNWLREKLFLKRTLKRELAALGGISSSEIPTPTFIKHHQSHAASAFFPSPYNKAAVLCLDGVGEWATSSVWLGDGNQLLPQWQINFPHSLGLLYSAFTYYTGFRVNSGEYKLMGLAPYGEPKYVDLILDNLIDVKDDGSFQLDMSYFDFAVGPTMTNAKFARLFGGERRKPESDISQKEMDIARSIQMVTEEIILRIANSIHRDLGVDYLCLAGGVALNCVANGRLLREGPFKDIWAQPASGDAGGALGAALSVWYETLNQPRRLNGDTDAMQGSYLGKKYSNSEIKCHLDDVGAVYTEYKDPELMPMLAEIIDNGNVVGWFSGRMEFGPRALGGRSIIGDPRSTDMQSTMNLKIKYRESFRPFAPAIKEESVSEWFEIDRPSTYMLFVAPLRESKRVPMAKGEEQLFGIEKLKVPRSQIPAVTHVDYSARIQTVNTKSNPRFYQLLDEFEKRTGCPILINTSFNVRGEPIVNTPEDAFRCFMRTEMDYLVIENMLLFKEDQSATQEDLSWKDEFQID